MFWRIFSYNSLVFFISLTLIAHFYESGNKQIAPFFFIPLFFSIDYAFRQWKFRNGIGYNNKLNLYIDIRALLNNSPVLKEKLQHFEDFSKSEIKSKYYEPDPLYEKNKFFPINVSFSTHGSLLFVNNLPFPNSTILSLGHESIPPLSEILLKKNDEVIKLILKLEARNGFLAIVGYLNGERIVIAGYPLVFHFNYCSITPRLLGFSSEGKCEFFGHNPSAALHSFERINCATYFRAESYRKEQYEKYYNKFLTDLGVLENESYFSITRSF